MEKKCSGCGKILPYSDFNYLYSSKDKLQTYCKLCQKKYRYKGKKKQCDKCMEFKPISEFYESRITEDGLFGSCKNCCKTGYGRKNPNYHYDSYFNATVKYDSVTRRK